MNYEQRNIPTSKLTNGIIAVGLRRTDNLYMLDTQGILAAPKYVKWRKIHE